MRWMKRAPRWVQPVLRRSSGLILVPAPQLISIQSQLELCPSPSSPLLSHRATTARYLQRPCCIACATAAPGLGNSDGRGKRRTAACCRRIATASDKSSSPRLGSKPDSEPAKGRAMCLRRGNVAHRRRSRRTSNTLRSPFPFVVAFLRPPVRGIARGKREQLCPSCAYSLPAL
jgi:hypothetical protein